MVIGDFTLQMERQEAVRSYLGSGTPSEINKSLTRSTTFSSSKPRKSEPMDHQNSSNRKESNTHSLPAAYSGIARIRLHLLSVSSLLVGRLQSHSLLDVGLSFAIQ